MDIRHDWTLSELKQLHDTPLLELLSKAHLVHSKFHSVDEVQNCYLISIKTGGCPEDCKYCAQSARYQTGIQAEPMMTIEAVVEKAKIAKKNGATRICLGAAWKSVREAKPFDDVLAMVKRIKDMGLEVCCTLGRLNQTQAEKLKQAGLYAYNHNIDSGENFYKNIITTRSFQDRLDTLQICRKSGITLCSGAIFGLGETTLDRLEFILALSKFNPHPESIPINRLEAIKGTPLQDQPLISHWEVIRMIALCRLVFPKSMIRLSAGRAKMSIEVQALCFLAGANSIFTSEKLLTVLNSTQEEDQALFETLGLKSRPPFKGADH